MSSRRSPNRKLWFAVAVLVVAAVVPIFSPALDGGFLSLDDQLYITGQPRVLDGLSWSGMRWAFGRMEAGYWHPLTWLSYMADIEFFGADPRWFHAVNLFFHAVNSLLLLAVLARLTGALWRSAMVALIFAVHPLHVESVAWIAERKDVLFGCFWLLATAAYHAYAKRPSAGRYLAVVLLFALGLMAKPMMVTLPFVLMLLDFWPLGRFRPGAAHPEADPNSPPPRPRGVAARLLLEKTPLLLLAALASGIAYLAQQEGGAVRSLSAFPFASRVANAAISYVAYLRDSAWPANLAVIYPHPRDGIIWWQALGAGLLLLAISAALLLWARKRPFLIVGWAWYLGTLVPVIGLVQVGLQSRADRFTYVPQIGLGLLAVWGIHAQSPAGRRRSFLLAPAAALVAMALAAATRMQAAYWRDDDTLLGHAIDATAENWLAHRHLALSLERRGRREEAMAQLRELQRLKPGYLDTHAVFGIALPEGGGAGEASPSAVGEAREATAHFTVANTYARQGLLDEAVREYREVLGIQPRHGLALNNLAGALKMQGRLKEASAYYRQAAEILPRNADVHANFGQALFELGQEQEALAEYHRAARINPGYTAEMARLADALRARGDSEGARRWYRDALDLKPDDAALKDRLATVP